MAFAIASAGFAIYQGIEQQKAGKAADKAFKEAAAEEKRQAAFASTMAVEKSHETLKEGQREVGARRALGASAGVGSGGSFGTQIAQIKARTRRNMELIQTQAGEQIRRHSVASNKFLSRGRRTRRAANQQAYGTFVGAGLGLGKAAYKGGYFGSGGSLLSNNSSVNIGGSSFNNPMAVYGSP